METYKCLYKLKPVLPQAHLTCFFFLMSRFLEEYKKHNVSFWGLTAQNEPTDGYIYNHFFQAMGFTPEQQRDFIRLDLGPALHDNGFGDLKLMILDDNRLLLPYWAEKVLNQKITNFLFCCA